MEEKMKQLEKMQCGEVIEWCQRGKDYRDVLSIVVAENTILPEGWLSLRKSSNETDFIDFIDFIDNQFKSVREKMTLHVMSPSLYFKFWMVCELNPEGDAIHVIRVSPVYTRFLVIDALKALRVIY